MTIFCIFMILLIGILAVYLGRQYLHKKADFGPLVTKALSGMLGISLLSVLVLWFSAPESVRETAGQPQLFPAIIYTVQMYSLDTNVEFLMGIAETAGTIGKVLMGILMVINPVLLLGTISRMILTEILHYGTKRYLQQGNLYIFPFHDTKSIYLASSILKEQKDAKEKKDVRIIFASLSEEDKDYRDVVQGLQPYRLPASSFSEEPLTALLSTVVKNRDREITVFFTEENYDLYEETYRQLYEYNASLYVFTDELGTATVDRIARNVEQEMKAKQAQKTKQKPAEEKPETEQKTEKEKKEDNEPISDGIKSYCIDPVKDSIWRHFLKLMNDPDEENDPFCHLTERAIHVSIAGWTPYGLELMKTMMWLGNLYGHHAYIHMYHTSSAEDLKDLFLYHFPAFSELFAQDMEYSYYCASDTLTCNDLFTVELNPVFSLKSDALVRAMISDKSLITAFTLADDTDNIHLLQKYLQRTDLSRRQYLFVHCEDEDIAAYARDMQLSTHISFIGIPKEFYSLKTIQDKELDDLAVETHYEENRIKAELTHGEKPDRREITESYRTSEYNRRSSMASALQKKASVKAIPKDHERGYVNDKRPLMVVEHDRWSAYMIALGYIPAKRDLTNTIPYANTIKPIMRHTDITPYDNLPADVKQYDNVTYIMSHMDKNMQEYLQNLEDRWNEVHK